MRLKFARVTSQYLKIWEAGWLKGDDHHNTIRYYASDHDALVSQKWIARLNVLTLLYLSCLKCQNLLVNMMFSTSSSFRETKVIGNLLDNRSRDRLHAFTAFRLRLVASLMIKQSLL